MYQFTLGKLSKLKSAETFDWVQIGSDPPPLTNFFEWVDPPPFP